MEIVSLQNVSKSFRLPREKKNTLKEYLFSAGKSKNYEELWALRQINFSARNGEFISFIGPNGSGKSTLLKLISKVYLPTHGTVSAEGLIAPFLELGVGFQCELSVKDNIYLYGATLGLPRREISGLFDKIIAFAELEKYIGQKIKNLSTGMEVRLAFSIAAHARAEILLVDEVLAVGDIAFQRKCFNLFAQFKKEGKTIIFVSHDLDIVEKFSDKVGWMDGGTLKILDTPQKVISMYANPRQ
jgi:ABC-2 type transport system ATP-binding protein